MKIKLRVARIFFMLAGYNPVTKEIWELFER